MLMKFTEFLDFDIPSIRLADLDWGLNFIHAYGEISKVSIKNQSLFNQVVLEDINFDYNKEYFVFDGVAKLSDGVFNFNFVQSDRLSSRKVLSLTGVVQAALFSNIVSPYSDIELIGKMPIEANIIFDTISQNFKFLAT